MNKPQIKNFSVWARRKLIETVSYRMSLVGITESGAAEALPQSTSDLKFYDIGTGKPAEVKGNDIAYRNELVSKIGQDGYKNTVEEIAYTWFNRLIAIRFMEVNNYLPSRVRVLSSLESGKSEPDIVTNAISVAEENDFDISADEIYRLKDENKADELFGKLFEFQCRQLYDCLPELFESSENYMEMLLPVSYTDKDGIIYHLVHDIPEDDFDLEKEGQVEIIGWLYQYYNTEPKDAVFAALKKNVKISKENIPAATQLFTPDWIVRYMVENSLGRLWLDGHSDCNARSEWKYYLEEAEQEKSVKAQLDEMRREYSNINPEQIKFIDPCMGSGHILVYAFDVLMQIYTSCGYSERDAAQLIIQKNLYGLDIDRRAYQLAYFALMMKARQYDRRFLTRSIKPNLAHFQGLGSVLTANVNGALAEFAQQFRDCDTYGSLTEMNEVKGLDEALDDFSGVIGMEFDKTERMMTIYKILTQKYDVVCTNPPYMGGSGMSAALSDFVKKHYPDSKSDLFAVFIERCGELAKANGFYAMITQHAFMFLSSYERLREKLLHKTTVNMAHLGARAFDEIGGEVVQTTAFVNYNSHIKDYKGTYARLVDIVGENEKKEKFLSGDCRYTAKQENFSKISGAPVAYWVSNDFIKAFESKKVGEIIECRVGLDTGNNNEFLRMWFEIDKNKFKVGAQNLEEFFYCNAKYVPHTKGGTYRKWYGNYEYVLKFDKINYNKLLESGNHLPSRQYYFRKGFSWTRVSGGAFSVRESPIGFVFNSACPTAFLDDDIYNYSLGFFNSKTMLSYAMLLSPTINFQSGDISKVPLIINRAEKAIVDDLVQANIQNSKSDWDSFETSWDFKKHPLIPSPNDENIIYFCLKISQEKWIKKLQQGEICFTPTHYFIEEAIRTGNDEQGDFYEGIFAKLHPNDKRIDELKAKLGSDLEIIEENGYILLRRHSSKNIPIFCIYGIYSNDLQYIDEPQENPKKPGEYLAKVRIDISDKMYRKFLQDSDVWGFYASAGHFLEAIEEMLHKEKVDFRKRKVNYSLFENDEFFIEPTDDYPELGYKFPKFAYQNEARIILNKYQKDRWVRKYTPLSDNSANISNCELYMEANCKCQNNNGIYISSIFENWSKECDDRFNKLKQNEEELNRIFIDIYGLQDELTPEVEDRDVTVRKADLQREIKSLISYAVGCMFGRYSLDVEGLAYAGGEWDESKYKTFIPDKDNCIPITDDNYFGEDDIVKKFADFIKAVYGEETLEENLNFIAEALGNRGNTSREVIRNYFLNDFFKDHIKIYQKRPIYWLFDSGKQNGFKALVYMHRWNADTIGNVRVEYLHKVQKIYTSELDRMQDIIDNSSDSREKAAAIKAKEKLTKQLKETKDYDASMAHLANMRIDIDLDDGVKVNYEKVQTDSEGKNLGILAKI